MQKTKFKIKGMHCQSCAILIEEKLKNIPGLIKAKISNDSGMGVIMYDENKIQETQIQGEIEKAGNYQVEKIKKEEIEEKPEEKLEVDDKKIPTGSSKIMLFLGFLVSFSLFSLILNIVLLNKVFSSESPQNIGKKIAQEQNIPKDNPQPSPSDQTPPTPAAATFNITKDNHIRGDFNAPITLVEFSDFECPFCERHYPTLNQILDEYKGKVRLVYKHFPLGFHPNAQKAAEASECADEQGKFWEYHDKLFENFKLGYSIENFKKWAGDLKLNSEKFDACIDSEKFAQKIQTDYQEGAQKGVNGTPATFVNGQLVSGALPYASFKQIIEGLLNK